jgi:hypothetical protein
MLRGASRRRRRTGAAVVAAAALCLPAAALAHLDHPAPTFTPQGNASLAAQTGGDGARWEFLASFPTGNPHTDLDFFTDRKSVV